MSPNLPTAEDPDQDPVLRAMALFNTSQYSEAQTGNVVVRAGKDVSEKIPAPSWIFTFSQVVQTTIAQDGPQDRQDQILQVDAYARSDAEVFQLTLEADRLILANRTTPGGKFAILLPGQWINNDALNQAEGLFRRTNFLTLTRFKIQT